MHAAYPPPSGIRLERANEEYFTFAWDSVAPESLCILLSDTSSHPLTVENVLLQLHTTVLFAVSFPRAQNLMEHYAYLLYKVSFVLGALCIRPLVI